jgi:hypothetical protein
MLDVGFCIYCGSRTPPLTREHIIPRGLGGNHKPHDGHEAMVLRHASCEACREITRQIEETCLLNMFGPVRRKFGMTRKDRRSPTSPVLVRYPDGREEVEHLPDEHLLGGMVIPYFRTAQCLAEATPDDLGFDYKFIFAKRAKFPDGAASVGVELKADALAFARMLAKIALGLAFLWVGADNFIPFVRAIILGTDEDVLFRVGGLCDQIPDPPKTPDALHDIEIREIGGGYLVAQIQLFSNAGGPVNYVVVGMLKSLFVTSERVRSNRALLIPLR